MEIEKMKRNTIHRLKEIKAEQELSISQIMKMMEERGQYVGEATLKKVFAAGSEEKSFRYQDTIMPIADVLLDLLMLKLEEQAKAHDEKETVYADRKAAFEKQILHLESQVARYEKSLDRKDDLIERLLDATITKE